MKKTIKNIRKHSAKIKEEAASILKRTNLLNTLSKFGEVKIVGSYELDLMYDLDIDVIVVCNNPKEASLSSLKMLSEEGIFQRYEYGDFVKFKFKNRPKGYILCVQLPHRGKIWEIEIWFLKSSEKQEKMTNFIKSRITPELKDKILEIKHKRNEDGLTKFDMSSMEIYKSVIENS